MSEPKLSEQESIQEKDPIPENTKLSPEELVALQEKRLSMQEEYNRLLAAWRADNVGGKLTADVDVTLWNKANEYAEAEFKRKHDQQK